MMGEALDLLAVPPQSAVIATHRQATMITQHRTLMPLTTDMLGALTSRTRIPVQRAVLHGVEISESTFDEWLQAGGDRRAMPHEISSRHGLSFTARRS